MPVSQQSSRVDRFIQRAAPAALRLVLLAAFALAAPLERSARADDAPVVPPKQGQSETLVLFDGKTLDGWEGHSKYWSVQNGVIIGKNTEPVPVSTYLVTQRKFSDFRLTASVKLVESEMHSGIAFWGALAPERGDPFTYRGHLAMFPSGWGFYDLYGRNGLPIDAASMPACNAR